MSNLQNDLKSLSEFVSTYSDSIPIMIKNGDFRTIKNRLSIISERTDKGFLNLYKSPFPQVVANISKINDSISKLANMRIENETKEDQNEFTGKVSEAIRTLKYELNLSTN